MKFLLALQFWDGDRAQALDTARLVADLEPRKNPEFDFLFSARIDSSHDRKVVEHVSRKFDTYTHMGRRRGTGWPAGCNDQWFDTMTRVYELCKTKKLPQYDAILTFEADCSPLRPGWLELLSAQWLRAKVKIMGSLLQAPGEHINGNAFFSGNMDFLWKIAHKIIGCSPTGGWDYLMAPLFKQAGWFNCPLMRSEWTRALEFTKEEYERQLDAGLVFHHGMKNNSLQKLVRARWLPQLSPVKA